MKLAGVGGHFTLRRVGVLPYPWPPMLSFPGLRLIRPPALGRVRARPGALISRLLVTEPFLFPDPPEKGEAGSP
jgi:hypothetical protein